MCSGFDHETGEMNSFTEDNYVHMKSRPLLRRHKKFHIPKTYLLQASSSSKAPEQHDRPQQPQQQQQPNRESTFAMQNRNSYVTVNAARVNSFQKEIILGYNKTSHRLFLIPSLFFFFKTTALLLLFCELILHIWAHRKNRTNLNDGVYYRSPMHVISSEFCALCRHSKNMAEVSKIQDGRRAEKLRQITRNIS